MINVPDILYKSFKPREPKEPSENITFAPSYLSDCARKIYYQKTGETPTNAPDLPALLKMHWGTILHDDIQARLKESGLLESFEERKEIEYARLKFIYYYDGILNDNGKRYILEVKTVYSSGFKSIEDKPKDEHVLQAISYMVFEGINDALIVYAGRDNGYLKQHHVELRKSEEWPSNDVWVNGEKTEYMKAWQIRINQMKVIKHGIKNKTILFREFSIVLKHSNGVITEDFQKDNKKYKSQWQCSYCSFKDKCWQKEYEEVKKYKFYIDGKFI